MLHSVFLKSLWDQRRSLPWWAVGLLAFTFITIFFYPSVRGMPEINAILGDEASLMRAFVGDISDITSPEGYLNSHMYYIMIPLLFLLLGITQGSGAIAGEEEKGTLDLLLSNPLTRSKVLIHKFASMLVGMLILAVVLWLGTIVAVIAVDMDIGARRVADITLSASLLGVMFGTMALTLGSATGKSGVSIGFTCATAIFAYLMNSLMPIADGLEPFSKLSPFYYYIDSDPLTNGLEPLHVAVLVGLTIVLLVIGVFTFERRDLGS